MLRPVSFLLIMVLWPFASFGALTDPHLHWRTVETAHFSIHYYQGEEEIARKLIGISEEVYDDLSKRFDARPWGKTEVVLVDNHDEANGFTTVLPYNLVVLRAVAPLSDSSLNDYNDWLRELFAHEYTHVLHLSDTRYPAKFIKFFIGKLMAPNGLSPGWVTEGLATYFESVETGRGRGRSSFTEMLLRTDILQGRFLKIDEMAGTQYDWPSWLAQYLYGVGFWNFLSEKYGEEKLVEFSHRYGATLWFFSLNNKAKRVFGKSFYKLWDDWKAELEGRYGRVKQEREAERLREGGEGTKREKEENQILPTFSPDGKKLAFVSSSVHRTQRLILRDLETGKDRVLLKGKDPTQVAFSPDGKKLVYSRVGTYKKYNRYWDLYEIDLETEKVRPLTKGKRVRDPDFSPDGKRLVCVVEETGRSRLALYDLGEDSKEGGDAGAEKEPFHFLEEEESGPVEYNHPRWSPDGRWIAVSIHRGAQRDLWLVDPEGLAGPAGKVGNNKAGTKSRRLTDDLAIEDRPIWDRSGRFLYYSSDTDGIYNIYRYEVGSGRRERVTNVLTGAFAPAISPQGELFFQYYNGKGFEIRQLAEKGGHLPPGNRGHLPPGNRQRPLGGRHLHASEVMTAESERASRRNGSRRASLEVPGGEVATIPGKRYNPFRRLFLPRYIFPNVILLDNAVFVSASTGNIDPLAWHRWNADATFRSDDRFFGYGVDYSYNRFGLVPFAGFTDFAVNYGDLFRIGQDFFEERRRASAGVSYPFRSQSVTLSYFFEHRSEESGLPAGTTLSTLGRYAGLLAQYKIDKVSETAAAISPEGGGSLAANVELTDDHLGASNNLEQRVVWGDGRLYLPIPFATHQVLALRGVGGAAFGDQLLQGNFGLGGSIGESPFTAVSSRLFTLRGLPLFYFSANRAWVASAEYRLPLFRVQRGLGTLPLAWNSAHLGLFTDVGDVFNRGDPRFRPMVGVGAELRGDFVVGYHLPLEGRLGYGILVTHRERIVPGTKDALTGVDARKGVLILEVGTSF